MVVSDSEEQKVKSIVRVSAVLKGEAAKHRCPQVALLLTAIAKHFLSVKKNP